MTMTNTGMTKSIDALGRIVLPKEIRKSLNLSPGSPLEMLMAENGDLILRKPDREIPSAELLALLRK